MSYDPGESLLLVNTWNARGSERWRVLLPICLTKPLNLVCWSSGHEQRLSTRNVMMPHFAETWNEAMIRCTIGRIVDGAVQTRWNGTLRSVQFTQKIHFTFRRRFIRSYQMNFTNVHKAHYCWVAVTKKLWALQKAILRVVGQQMDRFIWCPLISWGNVGLQHAQNNLEYQAEGLVNDRLFDWRDSLMKAQIHKNDHNNSSYNATSQYRCVFPADLT